MPFFLLYRPRLILCLQLFGCVRSNKCVYDFVKVAVQYRLYLVKRQPYSVVGHTTLREIVRAYSLAPVAGADL